jgi:hypothetical protein
MRNLSGAPYRALRELYRKPLVELLVKLLVELLAEPLTELRIEPYIKPYKNNLYNK